MQTNDWYLIELLVINSIVWNPSTIWKWMNNVDKKLLVLDNNTWNHLIVCKQMSSGSFKNVIYKLLAYKSYI